MRANMPRMPLLDALKALACLAIVLHHLAAYGPMSEIAHPLAPRLIGGIFEYGPLAVQVFLVLAGFLFAGKYAPDGILIVANPIQEIKRRYFRLILPYFAALILAIGCAAFARAWMSHASIPSQVGLAQLLAHAFLLQDLLDQEALSAGLWYVAIDFQLFALAVILLWISRQVQRWSPNPRAAGLILVMGFTLASLFGFNRDKSLDETAFYFFGSFGLGILIYWTSNMRHPILWLTLLVLVVTAALLVDFRSRIAVAGAVMLILGVARHRSDLVEKLPMPFFLTFIGRISYSIFLVHFPLCLVVNATFFHFFPAQPVIHAFGLLLAVCVSIFGGALFFRWTESGGSRIAPAWGSIKRPA